MHHLLLHVWVKLCQSLPTLVVTSANVRSGQEALPYREPISMNSQFLWMRDAAWFSKPLANGALRRGWVMAPAVSEASVTAALGLTIDVVSSLPPVRNMPLVCSRCIFMCATTNATMNDLAQLTQILRNRFILVSRLLHWTQADVLFFAACVWVGVKWAFYWGLSLANLHHVTARRALLPWNATGSCARDKNRQRLNLQGWQHHEKQCWGERMFSGFNLSLSSSYLSLRQTQGLTTVFTEFTMAGLQHVVEMFFMVGAWGYSKNKQTHIDRTFTHKFTARGKNKCLCILQPVRFEKH